MVCRRNGTSELSQHRTSLEATPVELMQGHQPVQPVSVSFNIEQLLMEPIQHTNNMLPTMELVEWSVEF